MGSVIIEAGQVTPEWLTDTLKRSGALKQGTVKYIQSQAVAGRESHSLTIEYSEDTADDAPRRLFLKLNAPALRLGIPGLGKKEVEFYNGIASPAADLPVPHCYEAVYSDEADRYHILMEDFSATHVAVQASQLPPTEVQCEQIIDALARVHAYGWDQPQLVETFGDRPTAHSIRRDFAENTQDVVKFLDFLGDRLSEERQSIYQRVMGKLLPLLLERLTGRKPLTLIFEDVHIGNFLYPRDPAVNGLVIVDWEQWAIGIGANDLAYMMAAFWFPERRARLERRLLERYLQRLIEYGVRDYGWDDLWFDYRLAVLNHLLMPAWRWKHGGPTDIWWNHLERLMVAYADLNCEELLQ